mgnify:CR=1 FL=1
MRSTRVKIDQSRQTDQVCAFTSGTGFEEEDAARDVAQSRTEVPLVVIRSNSVRERQQQPCVAAACAGENSQITSSHCHYSMNGTTTAHASGFLR